MAPSPVVLDLGPGRSGHRFPGKAQTQVLEPPRLAAGSGADFVAPVAVSFPLVRHPASQSV